ncbi:RDD family protein [Streptomyces sp. NPDC052415]|uniref:RDD family protein n=1 Tax=Streptomyces sp. NPDC052415 TaxID=3365690 RepID=UPI0037D14C78
MSSEPPPGSGQQPPEDDPFRKQPPSGEPGAGAGSPYDASPGGQGGQPPPYGGPYGGDPYGGGGGFPADPLAGMPPLADSGKRTLARIIDMLMVAVVVWLLTWAFRVSELDMNADDVDYGKSLGQSLIAALLYIGYDTFMIAKSGQTLGKKWLGMRVANLDNGATPSTQTALVRSLVLWIPFAFCCACVWTAICGGWSFFDRPYKQGLHDKAAKTVVVSTR